MDGFYSIYFFFNLSLKNDKKKFNQIKTVDFFGIPKGRSKIVITRENGSEPII